TSHRCSRWTAPAAARSQPRRRMAPAVGILATPTSRARPRRREPRKTRKPRKGIPTGQAGQGCASSFDLRFAYRRGRLNFFRVFGVFRGEGRSTQPGELGLEVLRVGPAPAAVGQLGVAFSLVETPLPFA